MVWIFQLKEGELIRKEKKEKKEEKKEESLNLVRMLHDMMT